MRSELVSVALVALFTSAAVAGPIEPSHGDESKRGTNRNSGSLMGLRRKQITTTVLPDPVATSCAPCATGAQTVTVTETVTAPAQPQATQTVTVVQSIDSAIQNPQVGTVTQIPSVPLGEGGQAVTVTEGGLVNGVAVSPEPTPPTGPRVVTVTIDGLAEVATISQGQGLVPVTHGTDISLVTITQGENVVTVGQGPQQSVVTITQTAPIQESSVSPAPFPTTAAVVAGRPSYSGVPGVFAPGVNSNSQGRGRGGGRGGKSITVNIVIIQFILAGQTNTIIAGQNVTSLVSSPPITVTSTLTLTEGAATTELPGMQNGTCTVISNDTAVLTESFPLTNSTNLYINNGTAPIALYETLPLVNVTLPIDNGTISGLNVTNPLETALPGLTTTLPLLTGTTSTALPTTFTASLTSVSSVSSSLPVLSAAAPPAGYEVFSASDLSSLLTGTVSTALPTTFTASLTSVSSASSSLPIPTAAPPAGDYEVYSASSLSSVASDLTTLSALPPTLTSEPAALSALPPTLTSEPAAPITTQTAKGDVVWESVTSNTMTAWSSVATGTAAAVNIPVSSASGRKSVCRAKHSTTLPTSVRTA